MKQAKKILSLVLAVIMLLTAVPVTDLGIEASAITFAQLNDNSVFLKQIESRTCTLCAAAMMMRRYSMLRGDSGWNTITESSIKSIAWLSGAGLYNSFSYSNSSVSTIKVANYSLPGGSSNKSAIIEELKKSPEGIVLYNINAPHAILLTDYTDGVFYCADPANGIASGRIPISKAYKVTINNATSYWKVTSPIVNGPVRVDSIPKNVWVSLPYGPESAYEINKVVNIEFGAEQADSYKLYIWREYENESAFYWEGYFNNSLDNKAVCKASFDKPGHYSCVITAYNDLGSEESDWIGWDIFDSAPTDLSIRADKAYYYEGETITFNLNAKSAQRKHIGIHKLENDTTYLYRESEVDGSSFSVSDFEPGKYRANFDAINIMGTTRSEWFYFYICNKSTHCSEKIATNKFLKSSATCTQKSVYYKSCSICGAKGEETFEYGEKLEHIYTSYTTQPTCTKEGVKTYKCSCGASYTEKIAKISHNSNTKIPAVAATCTKTGLTEGKKCSVCGTVTVAQQTVAEKGHKDNNFDGKCDNCGVSSTTPDNPTTPDEPTKDCSCNCHKGGIAGFFFKILNFFQKLFGINKVCACGVKH